MITRIEALNFRCLRYVSQSLGPFHVLVGPNASGKTTFLDVLPFISRLFSDGVDAAVGQRTDNFHDLVWGRSGDRFELAVEAQIPEAIRLRLREPGQNVLRYEVAVGLIAQQGRLAIEAEHIVLKSAGPGVDNAAKRKASSAAPATLISADSEHDILTAENRCDGGDASFRPEVSPASASETPMLYASGPTKLALANLAADESAFPATAWFWRMLAQGIRHVMLNSRVLRKASPPGLGRALRPDCSNMPWVIEDLQQAAANNYRDWIAHLRTALPDLEGIRIVDRQDDRHRYMMLQYEGGLEVPSWMVSDGTLRLLALTLPAYLPGLTGIHLVEEPENGIHPGAVETMLQSLSSVYDAQVLLATHSPAVLSMVDLEQVLCFTKTPEGATNIVSGDRHPVLRDWRGETSLGMLFAGGVLG